PNAGRCLHTARARRRRRARGRRIPATDPEPPRSRRSLETIRISLVALAHAGAYDLGVRLLHQTGTRETLCTDVRGGGRRVWRLDRAQNASLCRDVVALDGRRRAATRHRCPNCRIGDVFPYGRCHAALAGRKCTGQPGRQIQHIVVGDDHRERRQRSGAREWYATRVAPAQRFDRSNDSAWEHVTAHDDAACCWVSRLPVRTYGAVSWHGANAERRILSRCTPLGPSDDEGLPWVRA